MENPNINNIYEDIANKWYQYWYNPSLGQLQPSHTTSVLVQYGSLDLDEKGTTKLYICHVDCIASTISVVPFKVTNGNHNVIKWLFLRQKIFLHLIVIHYLLTEVKIWTMKLFVCHLYDWRTHDSMI